MLVKVVVCIVCLVPFASRVAHTSDTFPGWPPGLVPQTEADAQVAQAKKEMTGGPEDLLSPNVLVRKLASDAISEQRKALVRSLLDIVARKDIDKSGGGPFHCAVLLLGTLRAAEAVGALSQDLAYLPVGGIVGSEEALPYEAHFPCARSLTEIGNPAISAMVERIRVTPDETERKLAIWVILEIEGKEQASHRMAVLARVETPSARVFESARKYIEGYKPTFRDPVLERLVKESASQTKPPGGASK